MSELIPWLLGAVGTIVIAVLTAWAIKIVGPKPSTDVEIDSARTPLDLAEEARDSIPDPVAALIVGDAIAGAEMTIWVLEHGEPNATYPASFAGCPVRLCAKGAYTGETGERSRQLTRSDQVEGQWKSTTSTHCRIRGEWTEIK